KRQHQQKSDKAHLLTQHSECEICVRLGQKEKLPLPLSQSCTCHTAGMKTEHRLNHLKAFLLGIRPRIQESQDTSPAIRHAHHQKIKSRDHHHQRSQDVAPLQTEGKKQSDTNANDDGETSEIRLSQNQNQWQANQKHQPPPFEFTQNIFLSSQKTCEQ